MSYIKTDRRNVEREVFKTGPRFAHLVTAEIMWMRTYRNIFVWRVHTFPNWLFTSISRKEFTSSELFLTVGPRQLNPPSILLCFNLIHEPSTAAAARSHCSPRHLAHRDIWLTALQTSRTLAADDVMDPFLFLVSIRLIVGPVPQWVYTCPGYQGYWDTKRTSAVTSQCSFLKFLSHKEQSKYISIAIVGIYKFRH